jgi:hypothetical protein
MSNITLPSKLRLGIEKFDKWNGLKPTFTDVSFEYVRPVVLEILNSYEICHNSDAIGTISRRQGFCSKVANDFFYYELYGQLADALQDEDEENEDEITIKGKVDKFIEECGVKMIGQD